MMSKRTKATIIGVTAGVTAGVIALMAVVCGVLWSRGDPGAASEMTTAQQAVRSAADSGDYASVTQALERGDLDEQDVRQAVRQEFERQAKQRINEYFGAKTDAQRQAVLDQSIDRMQRLRAQARSRGQQLDDEQKAKMGRRVVAWALSQPPEQRARLAEFHAAMEQRRKERGLPSGF